LLRHLWEAPLYVAQQDYQVLEGLYERALVERDTLRRTLGDRDARRAAAYNLMVQLDQEAGTFLATAPKDLAHLPTWLALEADFTKRLTNALQPVLEPHEFQEIASIGWKTDDRYRQALNDEHNQRWLVLSARRDVLRRLMEKYSKG
jgi:hypothetical protein